MNIWIILSVNAFTIWILKAVIEIQFSKFLKDPKLKLLPKLLKHPKLESFQNNLCIFKFRIWDYPTGNAFLIWNISKCMN